MDDFVVIDTETTGLDRGSRALSLAAISCNQDGILDTREWTINPGMPIPPDVTLINGITDDDVKDSPDAGTVLREFFAWLPSRYMVLHNASYDIGILNYEAGRFGIEVPDGLYTICTLEIAKAIKATKKNNLQALVSHYEIQLRGEAHRALCDADACRQYFAKIRNEQPLSPIPWMYTGHDYAYCEPPFGLGHHVHSGEPFTFGYTDKDGETTERTVIPYGWAARNGECYFHGWCTLRQARREFRADRVTLLETA